MIVEVSDIRCTRVTTMKTWRILYRSNQDEEEL